MESWLIIFSCFQDIGTRLDFLEIYYQIVNVNILIVAYRGYSESTGTPTEKGLQIDSIVIIYKNKKISPELKKKLQYSIQYKIGLPLLC